MNRRHRYWNDYMHRKNLEKAKEVAEEAVEKNKLRQLLEKLKMLGKKK